MVALPIEQWRREERRRKSGRQAQPQVISIFRPEGLDGEPLPLVRRDALPEEQHYADAGCELAPCCLGCPLPACQYDAPGSARAWLLAARDREIATLRRHYRVPVDAIARAYGISRRSVFRIMREQRATEGK